MAKTVVEKTEEIKKIFAPLTAEQRYARLIELGRQLPSFPAECKTEDRQVKGCQSLLYLAAHVEEGKLYFQASADALISAGLAALLIAVYSGESAETILTYPPTFISELGLSSSLSPNRSNGLAHIHLRMKQEALKALVPAK